tara:strand:+ start:7640 stop:8146 length:507 start_codon:yes stop_codon:yes gene_type:complete
MNKKTTQDLEDIIEKTKSGSISKKDFRTKIINFEKQIRDYENSTVRTSYKKNDAIDTFNGASLDHEFGEGTYIRTITMPKDMIYLSAIHLITHPYFVMKGSATVISDKGLELIEAPYHGMTQPGTQRILYIHEECVWITVHPTNKTDIEEVVADVTSNNYDHPKLKIK